MASDELEKLPPKMVEGGSPVGQEPTLHGGNAFPTNQLAGGEEVGSKSGHFYFHFLPGGLQTREGPQ